MSNSKGFNGGGFFVLIIGVLFVGAAVSGIIFKNYWLDEHPECENGQALIDNDCNEYPYSDGNGATATPVSERWSNDQTDYKTPYDVFADAIRDSCSINNDCFDGAPNFKSEVEMFCVAELFQFQQQPTFPGNLAQIIIQYESESGFDFTESLNQVQSLCYVGGQAGNYIQGDLPTLKTPEA